MSLRESYISNWKNLPQNAIKIRVARPSVLGPSKELLMEYKELEKEIGRERAFIECKFEERYRKEIINNPKALNKINEIIQLLRDGNEIYLICYEHFPPCHRFILMQIINELSYEEKTVESMYYELKEGDLCPNCEKATLVKRVRWGKDTEDLVCPECWSKYDRNGKQIKSKKVVRYSKKYQPNFAQKSEVNKSISKIEHDRMISEWFFNER